MTESEIFRQPLCLVDAGPDGKMTVNTQVLNQLKCLDKEVVVVSIAGPYRTGKSYLMNKLAGRNKGKDERVSRVTREENVTLMCSSISLRVPS